jgi:class 3 adenylate cyclase/tetratricopeptide (TPR) repeat protein
MLYDNLPGFPKPKHTLFSNDLLEYEGTARTMISAGQLLSAIEVIRDGIKRFGSSPVLQQQLALALAQTGALDSAREVLGELLKESAKDVETLCLIGRVYKEMWRRATDPKAAAEALKEANDFYSAAFALSSAWYPGINLAFTLAAAGKLDEAHACAERVARICEKELKATKGVDDGWLVATLAEAMVHQGATAEAAKHYRHAVQIFAGRWRDLISMRRQAREIIQFSARVSDGPPPRWYSLGVMRQRAREFFGRSEKGQDWLDRCFEFPSVVVFAGHMLDRPGRPSSRFPADREAPIRDAMRAYLQKIRPGFGYSSAACGADITFCECLLELGAKVHLVLPCSIDAFKKQSVSFAGPDWEKRFHQVLNQASSMLVANSAEFGAGEAEVTPPIGFVYANRIVTGLAVLHARALDFELRALALWDGKAGDNLGGTSSVVDEWQRREMECHIIRPDLTELDFPPADFPVTAATDESKAAAALPRAPVQHAIRAMLSAEIVNFKSISERQLPVFISEFKGAIGRLVMELNPGPSITESWGKSYTFVFDDLRQAAEFALGLRDLIGLRRWSEQGLPADLGLRIVLHAGPIFAFHDPVTLRQTCIGSHVMRASRIEPITPPGQVYASQEFAALCSGEDMSNVGFEFLGRVRTATLFEEAPLYRLDWRKPNSV